MFNIYLGIYIVVALGTILGGTYKVYGLNQSLAAFLFFIGTLIIFIIYGLRWFGTKESLFSNAPVSWPPTINTCPDYLVYYSRTLPNGTKQESCIDPIGVSKNATLKVFPKDDVPPVSDDYYFSLVTSSSDPVSRKAELCQRAIAFGLTWEGITNGESCITPAGPVAPGGGSGGNNGTGCPTK